MIKSKDLGDRMPSARLLKFSMAGACALALAACSKTSVQSLATAEDSEPPKVDASKIDPKATTLRLADAAYKRADYGTAVHLYFRAAELQPNDIEINTKLGFALFKTGSTPDAEKVFRAVLGKSPRQTDATRGLAHSLVGQNKANDAIPIYRQAIEEAGAQPDPRLYSGLGAALDMIGKHADARAAYETGLKLRPNDPALRNNLAMSYILSGQPDKAKPLLESLVDEPASNERARQTLAQINSVLAEAAPESGSKVEAPRTELTALPPAAPPTGPGKRALKAAADVAPSESADGEIHIRTGRSSHAEHATGNVAELGADVSDVATTGANEAAEVLQLLAQAERGPRFVWHEARDAQTN